jgi:gamma-glutamyltranspeptidase
MICLHLKLKRRITVREVKDSVFSVQRLALVAFLLLTATAFAGEPCRRGMVASAHPLATQAGSDALKSGGNTIGVAVAVGLTLGFVDGHNSGIGGGCFMLIRRVNGEFVALDGREMAPAAATPTCLSATAKPTPNSARPVRSPVKSPAKRRCLNMRV